MIGILDYGAGNLRSVQNTLDEIGAEYELVNDAAGLARAPKIILPGVGHFGQMLRALDEMDVRQTLIARIRAGVPFLGICLGLQGLFESSEEAPGQPGLGIFPGTVKRFDTSARVPHLGWNQLDLTRPSRLLQGLSKFGHFDLLETLMLGDGHYAFLDRHLARLLAAATRFGHVADIAAIRASLAAHAATYPHQLRRVRLLVSPHGEISITCTALQSAPTDWLGPTREAERVRIAIATRPVDSQHQFLRYKTTARAAYDVHISASPQAFDVLLWNERGEITEFTRGNVVVSLRGQLLTPPLTCGLLPGVLRAELLEKRVLTEGVIRREALARADAIWFINSVRGWLPTELIAE